MTIRVVLLAIIAWWLLSWCYYEGRRHMMQSTTEIADEVTNETGEHKGDYYHQFADAPDWSAPADEYHSFLGPQG